MNTNVNDIVEFYLGWDTIPKKGLVTKISGNDVWVKIQHGELHNQEFVVVVDDIIDDSFDKYNTSDEKLVAWYDGE